MAQNNGINEERKQRLKGVGLHYCKHYDNIVRFNKPLCGKCSHRTYPEK